MKTIAVIPVHGRLPLVKITLTRLFKCNEVDHIICIGDSLDEQTICENCGAEFIYHKNNPLGKKWNAGFIRAKEYNPDVIVYVGSSDWLSDNWIKVLTPYVNQFDIVGKQDFNLLHIGKEIKLAHWTSYMQGSHRENEPIGIGRMLSRTFLERINWQPFDDHLNKALDYSMISKMIGGQGLLFNSIEIQSLAVSCDSWSNMHSSDFTLPNVLQFNYPEYWLKLWFPEALTLKI